jgi:hypothetical protein
MASGANMVSNIYLLLGIDEEASWLEVANAFLATLRRLYSLEAITDKEMDERLEIARERLWNSFSESKRPEVRQLYSEGQIKAAHELVENSEAFCRPKLGQLLVANGVLSLNELDAFLEIQKNTKTSHVPLGQLLMAAGYLSESQLEYYLQQQQLLRLPADHPQRWGQRLVELGLVNEDQLKVALIEQKTTGCTLRQAIINRGWLSADILDRIF